MYFLDSGINFWNIIRFSPQQYFFSATMTGLWILGLVASALGRPNTTKIG